MVHPRSSWPSDSIPKDLWSYWEAPQEYTDRNVALCPRSNEVYRTKRNAYCTQRTEQRLVSHLHTCLPLEWIEIFLIYWLSLFLPCRGGFYLGAEHLSKGRLGTRWTRLPLPDHLYLPLQILFVLGNSCRTSRRGFCLPDNRTTSNDTAHLVSFPF